MRFFLVFFLISLALNAQKTTFDSLRFLVNRNDTSSINLLNKLTLNVINHGHYDTALKYSNLVKDLARHMDYKQGLVASYNLSGIANRNKGNNRLALENYIIALRLSEEIGNKKTTSNLHHNIARIYENQGNYSEALKHLFISLRIKELNKDKRGIANTLSHIGNIYYAQNNGKALEYFIRSLKLQQEIKNYSGVTIAFNEIGKVYLKNADYKKAFENFQKSLEVNKTIDYKPEIANSLNHIGTIYRVQTKYKEALDSYLEALRIEKDLNNIEGQAYTLIYIAQLYFEQKEYEKALHFFIKGTQKADSSGVIKILKDAYGGLSDTYLALNNYKQALHYYKSFIVVRDSMFNDNNRKATITNQLKYEYEKKALAEQIKISEEKKLTLAQLKQMKTQSYALIVSLALIILIGFLVFQRIRNIQTLKVFKLRDKIANDLHDDIGSALSSISMFSGVARMNIEGKEAQDTVKKIEDTSRETIENMRDIVWSIQPKSDKLEDVVERMETFGKNLFSEMNIAFEFDVAKELREISFNMEQRRNFYLFYKEAINNAAKYSKATSVSVKITFGLKSINMIIQDDGVGFNIQHADSGNGLYTMRQRANELKGEISIISELNKGTHVLLSFKPT